jgi:hypothetical protein
MAPWKRFLCCFGIHSFEICPNNACLASLNLVQSFTDPVLRIRAAGTVMLAHFMAPHLFARAVCKRCGFEKAVS